MATGSTRTASASRITRIVVSALSADPAKSSALQVSLSAWANNSTAYFADVQNRLKTFVASGQLGPFANGYWGHPAYMLSPEANLLAVAHYLEALEWQRNFIQIHAILGGKNPHPQTYVVGGMAVTADPLSNGGISPANLARVSTLIANAKPFVDQVLLPDVLMVAKAYQDWTNQGRAIGNFMAYGEFPESDSGSLYLPGGIIEEGDLSEVIHVNQSQITETVAHSWYHYAGDDGASKHPSVGETNPAYTGPHSAIYDHLRLRKIQLAQSPALRWHATGGRTAGAHAGCVCLRQARRRQRRQRYLERPRCGPYRLVQHARPHRRAHSKRSCWPPSSRAGPTSSASNIAAGDLRVANTTRWDPATWPASAQGMGFTEAPRGALGHWVDIQNQRIANYQMVVPSTWNGSPRDAEGQRGPWERALIGTPIADPTRPIEILRTIHSFDPCMSCAVHLYDPTGGESIEVKVLMPPLLILGIGNTLMADEGIGVHVVEALEASLATDAGCLPPDRRVVDGGTFGIDLVPMIQEAGALLFVDAVQLHAEPGTVRILRGQAVRGTFAHHLSPHQMGLNDLLAVAELTGSLPPAVALVGIQPGLLGVGLEMSDALQAALPTAVSAAREAAWSLTEEQARA